MKKIVFILITLLSFSIISEAQKCNDKLKVGTTWEISTYNKKGKLKGKSVSRIAEIKNEGDALVFIIETQAFNKRGKPIKDGVTQLESKCVNGMYYVNPVSLAKAINSSIDKNEKTEGVTVTVDVSPANLPSKDTPVGTQLEDAYWKMLLEFEDSFLGGVEMSVSLINRTVEGVEEKTTPAGTFTCQKLESEAVIKNAVINSHYKTVEWYTDGYFLVRSEYYSKKGKLFTYSELTNLQY